MISSYIVDKRLCSYGNNGDDGDYDDDMAIAAVRRMDWTCLCLLFIILTSWLFWIGDNLDTYL